MIRPRSLAPDRTPSMTNPPTTAAPLRQRSKRWRLFLAAGLFVLLAVCAFLFLTHRTQKTTTPTTEGLSRTVAGNVLTSPADPAVRLTIDEAFEYLGGHRFELYGAAAAEQHFFATRHPDGATRSFIWLQFEAILPHNRASYDYSAARLRTELAGLEFFTDVEPGQTWPILRHGFPGTDRYLALKFAADRGFPVPSDHAYARLVHIPDEERRTELLIIFMEDLGAQGLSADALEPGGASVDRWPAIESALLDRIRSVIEIERGS